MIWTLVVVTIFGSVKCLDTRGDYIGCYRDKPGTRFYDSNTTPNSSYCIEACVNKYYRYASIRLNGTCMCTNYIGEGLISDQCSTFCSNCSEKYILSDIYNTGNLVPSSPQNLKVGNVTESKTYVSWERPDSFIDIINYQLKANVLHTFSSFAPMSPSWLWPNDTYDSMLPSLQPGTLYNITVQAVSSYGEGAIASKTTETKIGVPDNIPFQPNVINRKSKILTVKLQPVINNNGPVTSYRIAVINEEADQVFQTDMLRSYEEAIREGFSFYVAADVDPKDIDKEFVVGDGKMYGEYYNAPLEPDVNYHVLLGIVSKYHNITKVLYSNTSTSQHGVFVVGVSEGSGSDSSALIVGLSIAIAVLTLVLIVGIIGFVLLTKRVSEHRRRLTDNQELTIQGPIIEVENTAYIPEEEMPTINHYANLKEKVWSVPQSSIKIEPTNVLGVGKFGRVNSGTLIKEDHILEVAVYTIADRKLGRENKRNMLKDLDLLVRSGVHDNILSLVGTCDTPDAVFVIMECASMNLKDLLLGSRDALPGRFCNMLETQALTIAVGIANGLKHLQSHKIIHKQICARNILLTNGFVPKVSGYGLTQYCNPNLVPDYTRWTAAEVFKGMPHSFKSDIWSFSCLLWEICVLGGTPYGTVPNNEIPVKVARGLRLIQLQYVSDDLYQIMLNCWQIDMDERPTFEDLVVALKSIKEDHLIPHLNFNLYPGFQYEEFHPDMELAARTVF